MKIQTSDPDISTIYNRIKEAVIDLQPDFQRDLVWNVAKKQTLIDTILRGWHFPPIFLVAPPVGERLDVLDGQQRLNAIFEFIEGAFPVNGAIEPIEPNIKELDGLYFHQFPPEAQRKFSRYSIRISELYDYREDEPYELFFRLNQGSVLTPAEKRNTLYGPVREQVKQLVLLLGELGLNIGKIGFNNNRLAYEDVIARLLYALSTRSLAKKITDQMLIDMYRGNSPVSNNAFFEAEMAIKRLAYLVDKKVKLSKPTLFTWLLFFTLQRDVEKDFFYLFDELRRGEGNSSEYVSFLVDIFQEKTSTSVNDAVPVQLRLLIIFMVGLELGMPFFSSQGVKAARISQIFSSLETPREEILVDLMRRTEWSVL